MYGRKYVNLVEIGKVILEIRKAEFGNFMVPVNNTLVCLTSSFVFLAADTLLCVLMCIYGTAQMQRLTRHTQVLACYVLASLCALA